MNKEDFLKELEKELSFLEKEKVIKEINVYDNKFKKSKKSDEEVIKSLGEIDDIVKNIKIKYEKKSSSWVKSCIDTLQDLIIIFKKSDNKKRGKLIVDILFLLVITCVLKVPFIFIRNLGDNLLGIVFDSNIKILGIWGIIIELGYLFVALSFFMKTLQKWLANIN